MLQDNESDLVYINKDNNLYIDIEYFNQHFNIINVIDANDWFKGAIPKPEKEEILDKSISEPGLIWSIILPDEEEDDEFEEDEFSDDDGEEILIEEDEDEEMDTDDVDEEEVNETSPGSADGINLSEDEVKLIDGLDDISASYIIELEEPLDPSKLLKDLKNYDGPIILTGVEDIDDVINQ